MELKVSLWECIGITLPPKLKATYSTAKRANAELRQKGLQLCFESKGAEE